MRIQRKFEEVFRILLKMCGHMNFLKKIEQTVNEVVKCRGALSASPAFVSESDRHVGVAVWQHLVGWITPLWTSGTREKMKIRRVRD